MRDPDGNVDSRSSALLLNGTLLNDGLFVGENCVGTHVGNGIFMSRVGMTLVAVAKALSRVHFDSTLIGCIGEAPCVVFVSRSVSDAKRETRMLNRLSSVRSFFWIGLLSLTFACGEGTGTESDASDDNETSTSDSGNSSTAQACGADGAAVYEDTNSGLMWPRCPVGQAFNGGCCEGAMSTFMYCDTQDESCNRERVETDCGSCGGELISGPTFDACAALDFGGYSDWRVPNIAELIGMMRCENGYPPSDIDFGCANASGAPAVDVNVFPTLIETPGFAKFWASTSARYSEDTAFNTEFEQGTLSRRRKTDSNAVICVRASGD